MYGASHEFVDEERTLGEFMSEELNDVTLAPTKKLWRLRRVDRAESAWTREMVEYFGSEATALEGIRVSQERRREVLDRTALPALLIDTAAMQWRSYAQQIADFGG